MQTSFQRLSRQGLVVACASLLLFGVGFVFAAPTAPPPGTTVPLPLTRGAAAETKTGALTVQGALTASGGLSTSTLNATTICLGGDCKTAWPSGGVSTATTTDTAAYHPSYQCYGYNSYNNLSFYYNGSGYNSGVYNCGSLGFSLVVPSTIASGKTVASVTAGNVWCHAGGNNYNGYTPASSYITDGTYRSRTAGTITSITNNNNGTVTVNGNCYFVNYDGYSYVYMALRSQGLTFLTN